MPSKPETLQTGLYPPGEEGSQVGGAVRDEGEHARESKADEEKSREMQECSVDDQACPQQPCRGAESRQRGPVCPLHQRI